jgi:hypothetical protein
MVVHRNEMSRARLRTYSSVPLHTTGVASNEQLPLLRYTDVLDMCYHPAVKFVNLRHWRELREQW